MVTGSIFAICFVLFIVGIISGGKKALSICFVLALLSSCIILCNHMRFLEVCITFLSMASYYLLCNRNM